MAPSRRSCRARAAGVPAFCGGFVADAARIHLPWQSWHEPVTDPDAPWFDDVIRPDGLPHDPDAVALIGWLAASGEGSSSST